MNLPQKKKKWIWRKLARVCERYLERYNGFSYDFERGGEKNILRRLAKLEFKTVFDVGANVGEWTLTAREFFPKAVFHAFEISNSTFGTLSDNLKGDSFVVNNIGLSDANATIEYKDYGSHSRVNTLLLNADYHDLKNPPKALKANVVTGDSFCTSRNITFVDFLKIDVEGAEHLVIKGFDQLLSGGNIRCLQFEYGYTHGDAKFLMRDFFKLLAEKNYIIGKVRRDDIEFLTFNYKLNDFNSGPNYIAVRKTDSEIVSLLTGSSTTTK